MEAPNIQLYNLFRRDLRLTDGKSLELMHLLDKEYKSGVKDDLIALDKKFDSKIDVIDKKIDALDKKMDARFEKVDARFEKIEDRLNEHDKRFDALENKIDKKGDEVRIGLQNWMIGIILTMIAMFIASLFKK